MELEEGIHLNSISGVCLAPLKRLPLHSTPLHLWRRHLIIRELPISSGRMEGERKRREEKRPSIHSGDAMPAPGPLYVCQTLPLSPHFTLFVCFIMFHKKFTAISEVLPCFS